MLCKLFQESEVQDWITFKVDHCHMSELQHYLSDERAEVRIENLISIWKIQEKQLDKWKGC